MRAKKTGFPNFLRPSAVTVLCLCVSLLTGTGVRAQKKPPIFKSDGGGGADTASVSNILATYRANEAANDEVVNIVSNKLIYIAVEQIDLVFNDSRRKSRKRTALLQFIFDFLEIGASTAIAITNGERAKEVIAEALTGFKGGRTSINKNFKLEETQILFNKMVANRADRLSEIYKQLNDDVKTYPWERARAELQNYLFAGTIDDALSSLSIYTG